MVDYLLQVFRPFVSEGRADSTLTVEGRGDRVMGTVDGEIVLGPSSPAQFVALAVWWVNQRSIEAPWPELLIHAGVVALDGRAVLIPGAPDAGKSTLTAALVRAGFDYLSDEAARVDLRTGRILPFPRTLTLDARSLELLAPGGIPIVPIDAGAFPGLVQVGAHVPVSALRPDVRVPTQAVPGLVVVPHDGGSLGAAARLAPPRAALTHLVDASFNIRSLGSAAFRWIAGVAADVPCLDLARADPAASPAVVREALLHGA